VSKLEEGGCFEMQWPATGAIELCRAIEHTYKPWVGSVPSKQFQPSKKLGPEQSSSRTYFWAGSKAASEKDGVNASKGST